MMVSRVELMLEFAQESQPVKEPSINGARVEPHVLELSWAVYSAMAPAGVNWVISGKSENSSEAHFFHLCP